MRKKENYTIRLLYVIGIFFVITSHVHFSGGVLTEWFSENSFHMQMFFWASGYLYSDECEKNICGYLGRKVKRLLIPMVIYNIVYGLFTKVIRQFGFKIGGEITLYNIFISSFCYGSGFCFNSPDWFIAQLFIVEVLNVLAGSVFGKQKKQNEILLCIVYLVLGILSLSVFDINRDSIAGVVFLRTLFCLSWYGIGRLYCLVMEKYDKIDNTLYFGIVFLIQFFILMYNDGSIEGSVVSFSFTINIISLYLSAMMGIAFWLRVARIFSGFIIKNPLVEYVGKHTYSIVENQYLGFWLINFCLFMLNKVIRIKNFEEKYFFSMHNYFCIVNDNRIFLALYVFAGISVPLLISYAGEHIKNHDIWKFNKL